MAGKGEDDGFGHDGAAMDRRWGRRISPLPTTVGGENDAGKIEKRRTGRMNTNTAQIKYGGVVGAPGCGCRCYSIVRSQQIDDHLFMVVLLNGSTDGRFAGGEENESATVRLDTNDRLVGIGEEGCCRYSGRVRSDDRMSANSGSNGSKLGKMEHPTSVVR
ncbi:hypothetical protein ACLOJK_023611 [Asimina triloba]